jgi:(1->4)-alpha-D-glucan 1-alpha-D-glucosylmutase
MREAKVFTTWTSPNAEYENAVKDFINRILDPRASAAFLDDFRPFQRKVADRGLLNSLAQTVLRITAPGVPDTYQGTELWDFSLVDPDNRRPVDYGRRRELLASLKSPPDARELLASKADGRIKLFVTSRLLHARRQNPGLFSAGEYIPAEPAGLRSDDVFAFARRHGGRTAIVAVPRLCAERSDWDDTRITFGAGAIPGARYRSILAGETFLPSRDGQVTSFPVGGLLAGLPFAVLLSAF